MRNMMNVKFYKYLIDDELSRYISLDVSGLVGIINSEQCLENNILKEFSDKKTFKTKDEAYQFLYNIYKNTLSQLEDKLSKFDPKSIIEESMNFLTPLVILSLAKLNGQLDVERVKYDFPKIYKSLSSIDSINENNKRIFFTTCSTYIGMKKKAIDILININLVRIGEAETISSLSTLSANEFYEILNFSWILCRLFGFFQMVSKENNFSSETFYLENGKIHYPNSKDFMVNLITNAAFKDFTYPVDESKLDEIYNLYEDEFGFSPIKVVNTFSTLFINDKAEESVFCKTKDELIKLIDISKNTLSLKGMLTLFETDICLEYNKQDRNKFIFDNKFKVSIKGLVKIQDNYFFNYATIASYVIKFGNDLLNQDFLRNNKLSSEKISRYLSNIYAEKWLHDISRNLTNENIWIQIQVKNFEQKFNFPDSKGITKEVDFIVFDTHRNVLLIGEYKNWQDVSFNFLDVYKEQEKIKKVNRSHINLLNILNSEKDVLLKFLNLEIDYNDFKLELVNVFENRNILSNYNDYECEQTFKIKNFSRVEFEKYIENNKTYFLKIKD